jgi:hypothetical protein
MNINKANTEMKWGQPSSEDKPNTQARKQGLIRGLKGKKGESMAEQKKRFERDQLEDEMRDEERQNRDVERDDKMGKKSSPKPHQVESDPISGQDDEEFQQKEFDMTNQTQNAVFEAFEDVLKSDEDLELLEKGLRQKLKDAKNALTSTGSGGSGGSDGRGKPLTTADKLRNAQANRKKATADPNRPELESTLKGERTEIIGARRGASKVKGALSRVKDKLDQRENAPGAIKRGVERFSGASQSAAKKVGEKAKSTAAETKRRTSNVASAAAGAKSAPAKPTYSNPNMKDTPMSSAPKPKPKAGNLGMGNTRKIDFSNVKLTKSDADAIWEAFEDSGLDVRIEKKDSLGAWEHPEGSREPVRGWAGKGTQIKNKKASSKVDIKSGAAKGADDIRNYPAMSKPNKKTAGSKKSSKDDYANYPMMSKPNNKKSSKAEMMHEMADAKSNRMTDVKPDYQRGRNAGKGQTATFQNGQWQSNNPQPSKGVDKSGKVRKSLGWEIRQRRGEGLDG